LSINDRQQGWKLKVGEVSQELMADMAELGNRELFDDIRRGGPLFGFRWEINF